MFGDVTALNISGDEKVYVMVNSGLYFFTSRDLSDHTSYNDFGVRKGRSPQFSVLVSGSEVICL